MSSRALTRRLPLCAAIVAPAVALTAIAGCGGTNNANDVNLIAGKQQFVGKCGSCHTLARAGTKGTVGPNLDDAFSSALQVGMGRNLIKGIVYNQILYAERGGVMPQKLVTGSLANDVAAYVASAAANPGQDAGLLATAVPQAGAGKPAVEMNGKLQINADPSGQLAYVTKQASAKPGAVTVVMANSSPTQHNIALQQGTGPSGAVLGAGKVVGTGGISSFSTKLKPGGYTYFCQVPGHRAAGMFGTLTVK